MGGTQDNGTWSNNNGCNRNTFNQVIYGDGGNAVYDATNPTWRANEFTSGFGDSNFRERRPGRSGSSPRRRSSTAARPFAFYWPQIGDPNPAPGTHPIYNGRAARLADAGRSAPARPARAAGHDSEHRRSTRRTARSSSTSGARPGLRRLPAARRADCDAAQRPARTARRPDRHGLRRRPTGGSMLVASPVTSADHGTLWAATSAGRIFVTHNADAADPATVIWHRIDNAEPRRRGSRAGSTSTRPTRATRGSRTRATTPRRRRRRATSSTSHENGAAAGLGHRSRT